MGHPCDQHNAILGQQIGSTQEKESPGEQVPTLQVWNSCLDRPVYKISKPRQCR